jgi:hypothetical protein
MEAYPAPRRVAGRGRGRGGGGNRHGKSVSSTGRGRGDGGGRGGGSSGGRGSRGRGRPRGGRQQGVVDPADSNHDRYDLPADGESSSDEGVDFEAAASSAGMQSNILDTDKINAEDNLMRELAADFSGLGAVLASVHLCLRVGAHPSVLDALGDEYDDCRRSCNLFETNSSTALDAKTFLNEFKALGVAEDDNRMHASTADALADDGFDAWLDDA